MVEAISPSGNPAGQAQEMPVEETGAASGKSDEAQNAADEELEDQRGSDGSANGGGAVGGGGPPGIRIVNISMADSDSDEEEKKQDDRGAAAAGSANRSRSTKARKKKEKQYTLDVASLPTIKMEEVPKHKTRENCWTVVDGLVYDVTHYIPYHPGGKKIMLGAGREASETFRKCNQVYRAQMCNFNLEYFESAFCSR